MGTRRTGLLPTSSVPNTQDIRFLDQAGKVLKAPDEWEPALVEVPAELKDWQGVRVWRHDCDLPVVIRSVGGQARIVAEWPRSGVGHYQLWVRVGDEEVAHDLEIWPRKITQEEFVKLVEALENRLPVSL